MYIYIYATKAFDDIEYGNLFNILLGRNLHVVVIRKLMNMYTTQHVRVVWNGSYSRSFPVTNGVKQGGVLSPILFCVYIDVLLTQLKEAGTGCIVSGWFVGSMAYADDLVLLAPTAMAMSRMLSICNSFAIEFSMSFNASKTKCVIFRPRHYHDGAKSVFPCFLYQ